MCMCVCVRTCIEVYICMCVCICTSMRLYTCVCVCVGIFVHRLWVLVSVLQRVDGVMHAHVFSCAYVCVYVCVRVCIYVHFFAVSDALCMRVYVHVRIYVYVYMCVCVYVCICVYIHSRVGVHMQSCRRMSFICTVQSMRVYHRYFFNTGMRVWVGIGSIFFFNLVHG